MGRMSTSTGTCGNFPFSNQISNDHVQWERETAAKHRDKCDFSRSVASRVTSGTHDPSHDAAGRNVSRRDAPWPGSSSVQESSTTIKSRHFHLTPFHSKPSVHVEVVDHLKSPHLDIVQPECFAIFQSTNVTPISASFRIQTTRDRRFRSRRD
jgi:hypothetical protein